MNSIACIILLALTCFVGSITAASCSVCNNYNQRVYNVNLVHTIQNDRLGNNGKRNWSCGELQSVADSGGFTSTQCADAQQIASRYCACGAKSTATVETNGVCSFCAGKTVPSRSKLIDTFLGNNAITCGELIDGGNSEFWPINSCRTFRYTDKVESQCCSGISSAPSVGGFVACLSGDNVVNVQDKGQIRMDQVKIGDKIAVADGKFSRVYSFGHRDPESMTEYLQIHSNEHHRPIEITKEHMLFVKNAGAVPASLVSVGDELLLTEGTASVTKISKATRKGAYAPFTESGTLIVSDVLASSFISVIENEASLNISGVKVASLQWLAHAFEAPHRLVCKINPSFCESETYTRDGISHWVNVPFMASMWLVNQNAVVQAVLSSGVLSLCTILYLLESLLTSSVFWLMTGMILLANNRSKSKNSQTSVLLWH